MNTKKYVCGNEQEKIPNIAFRLMALIVPFVHGPKVNATMDQLGLKEGMTFIDYGCGPGVYIKKASELVGETGQVYAVDIHPLAMKSVQKLITKYDLKNVKPVLAEGYRVDLSDHTADLIMVLDTFHMIKNTTEFLREINRLLKPDGFMIIDEGHQPREEAKQKIIDSGFFTIAEEKKSYMKWVPIKEM